MKKQSIYLFLFLFYTTLIGCSDTSESSSIEPVPGYILPKGKDIYIPLELRGNDFTQKKSQWSYHRMAYSDNWVCFWEEGFGADPLNTVDAMMRIDIKDLLVKAELFYNYYVNELKFIEKGKSKADKYRMMIFLKYQSEWLATGAGYDDVIGALWVNPSTCQPVGSVIAHEVGHSFQYQTYCDNPTSTCGWRYGFGINGEGGNGWWEQCAQWQSFKVYPKEQFTTYNYTDYLKNTHKHLLHEESRYASYFIQDYWCMKHGMGFIGKLWRESKSPEDPIETYQRLAGINQEMFNDEMFDAACRFVNWDVDGLREFGRNYVGRSPCKLIAKDDDYYTIAPEQCVENYGYNAIPLHVPIGLTTISVNFEGLAGTSGYRSKNIDKAGWRYGFVACLLDGSCTYSQMFSKKEGVAFFDCPANCQKLYFVVSGAPTVHWRHAWDDNNTNDEQWPYKVKFNGVTAYGENGNIIK